MTSSPRGKSAGSPQPAWSLRLMVRSLWEMLRWMLAVEIVRYFLVGSCAALLQLALVVIFIEIMGFDPLLASTTALSISICVNYRFQHLLTFRSDARHVVAGPRFITVTLATMTANAALFSFLLGILPYLAAQIVTLLTIFPINYLLNKSVTFRSRGMLGQRKS